MSIKTQDGTIIPDIYGWRKHLLATQAQEFARIFKLPLSGYLSVARGFNMNQFAWKIGAEPEAGRNWREVVPQKYGAEGMALLNLITGNPQRLDYSPNSSQPTAQTTAVAALFAPQPVVQQPAPVVSNGVASLFGPAVEEEETEEEEGPATGSIASLFG